MENKQNILEYLDALQIEYLLTEIRFKIYQSPSDKKHYQKVMRLKEEKINDIAVKNSLNTIFNSRETKNNYINKVYPVKGMPNFGKYIRSKDVECYYSKKALVKVYPTEEADKDDFKFAEICHYKPEDELVGVQLAGESDIHKVKSHLVTRIL